VAIGVTRSDGVQLTVGLRTTGTALGPAPGGDRTGLLVEHRAVVHGVVGRRVVGLSVVRLSGFAVTIGRSTRVGAGQALVDQLGHRRQEDLDQPDIQMAAADAAKLGGGVEKRPPRLVGALGEQSVEHVTHRADAPDQRDVQALQTLR